MDRTRTALREMAREDPELAARLVLQSLPAAAARIRGPLRYELAVGDMGTWLVVVDDDGARVEPGSDGEVDFVLSTNAEGLARLAAGASPLRLMLGGTVPLPGKRRRAMKLPALSSANGLSLGDAPAGGASGTAGRPAGGVGRARERGPPGGGRFGPRPVRGPDDLRRPLRAVGAPELEGPRARLLDRPRAVGVHAERGAGEHRVEPRRLLHRRGAGDGRPGTFPRGRPERRGGGLPRHPARRRGAPRRILRPLRRGGDGARGRRPA